MNSQSWKRLFTPNIKSKPDSKISILGNKTIIRPKKRKDIENDFQWRTDTELSDLDATVPINLSYEQFERISVNELSKSSQWSEKFSIENHEKKHIGNQEYFKTNLQYSKGNNGLFAFEMKRNIITNSSEYYNLSYEYLNDCLRAGIVYRREFYNDSELESENSLMFKITLTPFGDIKSPSFNN